MSYKRFVRYLFNIIVILLWITIFYLQFERPFIARTVQNISPTLLVSTLAHNLLWLSWISVPLLLIAIIKGRFFCWNICPVGLLLDIIPSFARTKITTTNLYIFLGLFTVSLFGLNLLAIFDPLVNFNSAVISFQLRRIEFLIFFSVLGTIILLSIYKKRFWCFKLCPLGAIIDWTRFRKPRPFGTPKGRGKYDLDRRKLLISIGSGFVFGGLLKVKNLWSSSIHDRLLRPPGALPENEFTDRCIRCGSCIAVCLTKTLTPVFLESGVEGVFTPRLVPYIAECDEFCNKCGEVCPTQAIKNLPLTVKRNFKIGTAKIDRSICISWRNEGLCLICQEHCPYLAIMVVRNESRNLCPLEIPEVCRGCGFCEKVCPTNPTKAIVVYNTGAGQIINNSAQLRCAIPNI